MRGKVLVVACSSVVRFQVRFVLEKRAGYAVVEAETVAQVVHLLPGVTLVISEARSARIDGLEVLAAVRAATPALPVILLATEGQRALMDAARRGGASAWAVKPIDPVSLTRAVVRLAS